ncbi:hypothetical protein G6F57_012024 [Rhizopus arrhizus]|uniref:Uncharacterized protein n=1 Tax=Rhizopus oryzae TaxID=64495 RepID=A0A9P7BMD1_RHIOR|nr:hypothetical protein G6F24_009720 [Rhizopus arrhizus]KAG1412301.1 hypothetical protein G6F58_008084 [Rhizopus delemar]KAG0779200.1 hypothetical protein G6F22_010775 [Rhizopus arrhizus]KAG0786636.1 hypothetical protein G6F21_008454 [Rhizopus arrhizus]KAG0807228.1 hypothetical protein G6F20_010528 [Rhizopus arrhizus]
MAHLDNLFYDTYTSYEAEVKPDDPLMNTFSPTQLQASYYNPDTNGWCGYCCLAWVSLDVPSVVADGCGIIMKKLLLSTLIEHEDNFKTYFASDYAVIKSTLECSPNETTDWWFIVPDFLWIASIAFRQSFLFFMTDYEKPVLIQHPHEPLPSMISLFFFINDQLGHGHFKVYKISQFQMDSSVTCVTQELFNTGFQDLATIQ